MQIHVVSKCSVGLLCTSIYACLALDALMRKLLPYHTEGGSG